MTDEWKVAVGSERVSAAYDAPTTDSEIAVFICAHGAGGTMSDRGVLATTAALRANGIGVVRFNFLYKEKKSGRPDPMPRLTETFAAVTSHARSVLPQLSLPSASSSPGPSAAAASEEVRKTPLIIGGRSMGGRAASVLAADNFDADGLLLLAYPLHPPGKPNQLRDAHLPSITMPVLCFNGTRDEFCTPDLMRQVLERVSAPWDMHWIEGADHSFHVLKSSGRTDAEVMREIGITSGSWISGVGQRR